MRIGLGTAVGGAAVAALAAAGCGTKNYTAPTATALGNPDSLTYTLLPAAPGVAGGVLLQWAPTADPNVVAYAVFARTSTTGSWATIATTVLNGFDDQEIPSLQYYVASEDAFGDLSTGTPTLTVDTTAASGLPAPDTLVATPFDSAAQVTWAGVANSSAATVSYYRVFSEAPTGSGVSAACPAGYSLTNLFLEGTTVSDAFATTGLANDAAICYAVSTVATSGEESVLSPWTLVTPSASDPSLDRLAPMGPIVVHGSGRRMSFAFLGSGGPRRLAGTRSRS
jgi:hypothetical protein